jgi:SAM-dependent methyltransferase
MSATVPEIGLFTAVDQTGDPGFFSRFLTEGNALADIQAAKPIILAGLDLHPGMRVLDAGCGTGDDAVEIAHRVGASGHVTGIDISQSLITEAAGRADLDGLGIDFQVGDAQALRFDDATFDAVRTERMLMHVVDETSALAELTRVLRPGRRLSVFDFDWDTMIIDSPDKDTTRTVVRSFSDSIRHGWIGRQLPRRLRENGYVDVTTTPHQVKIHLDFARLLLGGHLTNAQRQGLLQTDQLRQWWQDLESADRRGTFTMAFTAYISSGRKG